MAHAARAIATAASMAAALVGTACKGEDGKAGKDPAAPPPPRTAVSIDAGVPIDAGITTLPSRDPDDGFHVDPIDPTMAEPSPPVGRNRRRGPTVSLLLRSTPPGAEAAVDSVPVGRTPVLWEGEGMKAHEFTFTYPGHSLGRYKFVPITDGVVHGTLMRQKQLPAEAEAAAAAAPATVGPVRGPAVRDPAGHAARHAADAGTDDAPAAIVPPPNERDVLDAGFPPELPPVPIDAP